MSVALDPRLSGDRVFQYGDYQQLAARYRRRKKSSWYQDFFRALVRRPGRAVRLAPYRLACGLGVIALAGSLCSFALLSADSMRLAYSKQEMERGIAGIDQVLVEAVQSNAAGQTEVLTQAAGPQHKVQPPADTNYVVLSDVPEVGGQQLAEQLYPLSRRVIEVRP